MPFLTPLKVQLLNDREVFPWITLAELVYEDPDTGVEYVVPKHFRTDGASIPKALVLVPVVGPTLFQRYFGQGVWQGFREGVLHDYLLRGAVKNSVAHDTFRKALTEAGYPTDLVETYYSAVKAYNP